MAKPRRVRLLILLLLVPDAPLNTGVTLDRPFKLSVLSFPPVQKDGLIHGSNLPRLY